MQTKIKAQVLEQKATVKMFLSYQNIFPIFSQSKLNICARTYSIYIYIYGIQQIHLSKSAYKTRTRCPTWYLYAHCNKDNTDFSLFSISPVVCIGSLSICKLSPEFVFCVSVVWFVDSFQAVMEVQNLRPSYWKFLLRLTKGRSVCIDCIALLTAYQQQLRQCVCGCFWCGRYSLTKIKQTESELNREFCEACQITCIYVFFKSSGLL